MKIQCNIENIKSNENRRRNDQKENDNNILKAEKRRSENMIIS